MRVILAVVCFGGGLALAAWLGSYLMLYRGITEAIACPNAGSILKACFFEAGCIPGMFLWAVGIAMITNPIRREK